MCPFSVQRPNLRTISGEDEGFYGALSANYLSGVIDAERDLTHDDGAILGALDLGGSSTQVMTFAPSPVWCLFQRDTGFKPTLNPLTFFGPHR